MARSNQTETAVLGALSVAPMTGYALRAEIRDVLGHFWSESYGQIYPTLAALDRQGLVTRQGAERTGASTFAITPAGRARLKELLGEPVRSVPPRDGLMLRMFFGRQLGTNACRALVLDARERARSRLAEYAKVREEIVGDQATEADHPYWLMTLSAGEHNARAALAWTEETLATLDLLDRDTEGKNR